MHNKSICPPIPNSKKITSPNPLPFLPPQPGSSPSSTTSVSSPTSHYTSKPSSQLWAIPTQPSQTWSSWTSYSFQEAPPPTLSTRSKARWARVQASFSTNSASKTSTELGQTRRISRTVWDRRRKRRTRMFWRGRAARQSRNLKTKMTSASPRRSSSSCQSLKSLQSSSRPYRATPISVLITLNTGRISRRASSTHRMGWWVSKLWWRIWKGQSFSSRRALRAIQTSLLPRRIYSSPPRATMPNSWLN